MHARTHTHTLLTSVANRPRYMPNMQGKIMNQICTVRKYCKSFLECKLQVQMQKRDLFCAVSPVSLVSAVAVATPNFIHLPVPTRRVKF